MEVLVSCIKSDIIEGAPIAIVATKVSIDIVASRGRNLTKAIRDVTKIIAQLPCDNNPVS